MKGTAIGAFARNRAQFGIAYLVALNLASWAYAQRTQSFNLKEVGLGPDTTIELEFPFTRPFSDVVNLTSPSGEVFNAAAVLDDRLFSDLIKTFPSLDAAFSFMTGTWHGTYEDRPFGGSQTAFEFTVDLISPDSVYRGLPQHISVKDSDRIRNGQSFMLSWDYLTDEPLHRTYLQVIPQFGTGPSGSLTLLSTPHPGSSTHISGSIGVGDRYFAHDLRSEPETSDNRFITTFTAADAALPLNVELTFGAATLLDSAIANQGDGDSHPYNDPPTIGLRYIATADPFQITLVDVPEPSAIALASVVGICALAFAAHWRKAWPGRPPVWPFAADVDLATGIE